MSEIVEPDRASTVSVVLPVHAGIAAEHLDRALGSLLVQSRLADEIVVVEDGPLPEPLQRVLSRRAEMSPGTRRIRLAENQGAGVANDRGLHEASGRWIAKMDADDIALPGRIERQHRLAHELGVDVLGAAMAEFSADESVITRIRPSPHTHEDIARRMPWNNPINHSTAFYRRDTALSVGGYPHLRYLQDYGLFARMLAGGAVMHNVDEPLVLFRSDASTLRRRKARAVMSCEFEIQRLLQACGLIGPLRHRLNLGLRLGYRMLPTPVLRRVYDVVFTDGHDDRLPAVR